MNTNRDRLILIESYQIENFFKSKIKCSFMGLLWMKGMGNVMILLEFTRDSVGGNSLVFWIILNENGPESLPLNTWGILLPNHNSSSPYHSKAEVNPSPSTTEYFIQLTRVFWKKISWTPYPTWGTLKCPMSTPGSPSNLFLV